MRHSASTLDDAVRLSFESILADGSLVKSTRGDNLEIVGAQIELTNPLARLCLAENRATLFSCLGEFLWYMGKRNDIEFITYYAQNYAKTVRVVDGKVPEAYGPRLFAWDGHDQVEKIIALLKDRIATRQATIQLFDRVDLVSATPDVPCTCLLQFLCRGGQLHLITTMRSNDVVMGLPHDTFAFTMLQELIARDLGVELGVYRHWVGSLHMYLSDKEKVQALIEEGWQQTIGNSMDPMPPGDPWPFVTQLLEAEQAFRADARSEPWGSTGSPYWDSLIWLLEMLRHFKQKDLSRAEASWHARGTKRFDHFIESRLRKLRGGERK